MGQTFEQTFLSPPEDARVMMRWWWFGPSVTRPELLREMQQMKAGGIGGFEIQPVYPLALDDPQAGFRNFPYLSDEFLQDVRYANDEAAKLGLRVSLTLSSGWPYGGPNTPVTEAAGAIHLETKLIAAGETSIALPALSYGRVARGRFYCERSDWSEKTSDSQRRLQPTADVGSTRSGSNAHAIAGDKKQQDAKGSMVYLEQNRPAGQEGRNWCRRLRAGSFFEGGHRTSFAKCRGPVNGCSCGASALLGL